MNGGLRTMAITKEKVIEGLKQSFDPELHLDVYTLGLVYDITVKSDAVKILMTLTTPLCPYGPMLIEDVKAKVKSAANAKKVDVDITFEPPWKPSDELKMMLGLQ